MIAARFHIVLLVFAAFSLQNCGGNDSNKPPAAYVPQAGHAAQQPAQPTPIAASETQPTEAKTSELKKGHLETVLSNPQKAQAEQATTPVSPSKTSGNPIPDNAPAPRKNIGPAGSITRTNVLLLAEPKDNAAKVATLKLHETIFILETSFRDAAGKVGDYPTWYKVQRENKQQGWVTAKAVDAGGGG